MQAFWSHFDCILPFNFFNVFTPLVAVGFMVIYVGNSIILLHSSPWWWMMTSWMSQDSCLNTIPLKVSCSCVSISASHVKAAGSEWFLCWIFLISCTNSNEFLFSSWGTLCFDRVQCLVGGRKEGRRRCSSLPCFFWSFFFFSLQLVVMMYGWIEWTHRPLLDMITFRWGSSMWIFIPESSIYAWWFWVAAPSNLFLLNFAVC